MRFLLSLLLLVPSIALAQGVPLKDGNSGTLNEIDTTSQALRTSDYDTRGNFVGQKATYSAGLTIRTNTTVGTTPFFAVCGSASKTLRLQRFYVSGSVATAAVRGDVVLLKTSTAPTGGTATALTIAPHDSNSTASGATVNFYTTLAAAAGTSVGSLGSRFGTFPITATVAATDQLPQMLWEFTDGKESEAIVLRGIAQCMTASFATTTTNVPTLLLYVKWTEE